jgi:hypothetical protein
MIWSIFKTKFNLLFELMQNWIKIFDKSIEKKIISNFKPFFKKRGKTKKFNNKLKIIVETYNSKSR